MNTILDLRCEEHHGSGSRCIYSLGHGCVRVEGGLRRHGDGRGNWWGDAEAYERDRIATRDELMAIEVGRALRFAHATLVTPGRSTHDAIQATVTVLADHSTRLASRFGPCWLEEARERGLV